jgi:hypothetical protein
MTGLIYSRSARHRHRPANSLIKAELSKIMVGASPLVASILVLVAIIQDTSDAFRVESLPRRNAADRRLSKPLSSTTEPVSSEFGPTTTQVKKLTQTLGLLTFDLDDSLYPIAKVEEEANRAFVKSMAQYGFDGLKPSDIVTAAQEIRDDVAKTNPAKAAALTHAELRLMAIRREMERVVVERKLAACAEDWATTVDSLSKLVVANSKKYVLLTLFCSPYRWKKHVYQFGQSRSPPQKSIPREN